MEACLAWWLLLLPAAVLTFNIDTSNPIIYDDVARTSSQRSTYFGYSVLLNKEQARLVVGAPRSNSSYLSDEGVIEPGVVYACSYLGPCQEVALDFTGNEVQESVGRSDNIWDLKDHAWIGGAMDLEQKQGGRLVVCAPRWQNQYYKKTRKEYFIPGLCYFMFNEDITRPAIRMTPTTAESEILFSPDGRTTVFYHAMSQAGMSVHLMPDNKDIGMLLGAPGLLNWRGGVVEYPNADVFNSEGRNRRSADDRITFDEKARIINPYWTEVRDFDYLGYQVTSGHFFHKTHHFYAASSPRGANFKGYVLIIDFPPKVERRSTWNYYDKKQGQEFGEYFGYSITAADINGDGYDDLVVGAPFYSKRGEQMEIGRIHVFLGSKLVSLQKPKIGDLIEGFDIKGRFGSAVVALGDINQDGYADIAVGAPYEDERRGAVYIFNGSPRGLNPQYSQRIGAADIHPSLRGFGVSISPPDDMDGNKYDDVAVGAFLSGHTVLFRTYPVVQLYLTAMPSVNLLRNETSSFSVNICHSYTGRNAPPHINVTYWLTIDEKYNRAQYNGSKMEVTLEAGSSSCHDVPVQFNSSEDNMEDVKITVQQDVVRRLGKRNAIWIDPVSGPSGKDTFCKNCPLVEEADSVKQVSLRLQFARDCDPCRSDLKLSCGLYNITKLTSLNGEYILGSGNIIRLFMNVSNFGDVSYGTYVSVILPENVNIRNLPVACREEREGSLSRIVCDFKVPLREGSQKSMPLDLDMSYATQLDMSNGTVPSVTFQVEVKSNSIEQRIADNAVNLTLNIRTEADFVLFGRSREELYPYLKEEEDEDRDLKITFNQIYRAVRVGRSPVQELQVKFWIPMVWTNKDIHFLSMYPPEGKLYNQPVKCTSDDAIVFKMPVSTIQQSDTSVDSDRMKRSVELREEWGPGFNNHVQDYPSNRSLYLNCSTAEVECYSVTCTMTQLEGWSLELELVMELDVESLESLMKDKDIIHVSTEAEVSIQKPVNMKHSDDIGPNHITVSSTFVGTLPEKKVAIWVIVLSVVGGILLLLLLIIGLVKAGFFRRTKKEEMEALKSADDDFEAYQGSVQLVPPPDEKDGDPFED